MKRFEVMQVEKSGTLIDKLVKPGTTLCYAFFEIIKEYTVQSRSLCHVNNEYG